MAEAVSAVGAVFVASACIYYVLVLLQVLVNIGHESRINLIHRQHWIPVDGIGFYLGGHLQGVFKGLGVVREQGGHLLLRLDVLLLEGR